MLLKLYTKVTLASLKLLSIQISLAKDLSFVRGIYLGAFRQTYNLSYKHYIY
jgi:hypothetical protein